jgi:hypothetical protein
MTHEEHRARHVMLHGYLDELFADFIMHHPGEPRPSQLPIEQLLKWSNEQQRFPVPLMTDNDHTTPN